ncbi:MAG: tetratricopeptide repeat protein [bacterium]|nr:tetratricopeptide repeat protein [bacterium]
MGGSHGLSRNERLAALALVVAAFVAYVPAISGGFIWDDDAYVSENVLLHDAGGLWRIWTTTESPQYYPMVFTTFWLEHLLWGLNPAGYHLVNVALHALNALLVALALRRLSVPGAWWVAALFALHPVHVESVAWITERKNVLSASFYLLALLSYLRFEKREARGDYLAAIGLFVGALLSKTVTSSLPVVILMLGFWRRGRVGRSEVLRLGPFFLAALALGSVTVLLEQGIVSPVDAEFALSWSQRVVVAAQALLFYAGKLVWPHPLIFNYPRFDIDPLRWAHAIPVLLVVGLVVALVAAWRRGMRGTVVAAAYFAITLFPALGFFDVYPFRYSFVADHFQYLASLGILVLLVQSALRLSQTKRVPASRWVGTALLVALAILTWNQCRDYRDLETLWRRTLVKNPDSWIAHNNLALLHYDGGDLETAFAGFEAALRSNPESAESFVGRGMIHAERGDAEAALRDFEAALQRNPDYPQAFIQRGELYAKLGRPQRVIDDFTRVLVYSDEYVPAYRHRGVAFLRLGRFDDALRDFTRAIELGADHDAFNDRGTAYLQLGRVDDSIDDFTTALDMQPEAHDIRHNRGMALMRGGRPREALSDFGGVLAADPEAVKTLRARGAVFLSLGDSARACADWESACRLGQCSEFRSRCSAR